MKTDRGSGKENWNLSSATWLSCSCDTCVFRPSLFWCAQSIGPLPHWPHTLSALYGPGQGFMVHTLSGWETNTFLEFRMPRLWSPTVPSSLFEMQYFLKELDDISRLRHHYRTSSSKLKERLRCRRWCSAGRLQDFYIVTQAQGPPGTRACLRLRCPHRC